MNKISINRQEMNMLIEAVRSMHLALELEGKSGSDEHRSLRYLEDTLGGIGGEKFYIERIK